MNDHEGRGPDDGDDRTDHAGAHEAVGSVAEEAAKLLGALSGWAHTQGDEVGRGFSHAAQSAEEMLHAVDEHLAPDPDAPAECRWCPVCRGLHAVRQLSPEVRDHLASATASLAQAVAAALATTAPGSERRERTGFEHIDLDGDDPATHGGPDSPPEPPGSPGSV